MTDTERIAALETAVEEERRERSALGKLLLPETTETRRGLETLEETFSITMQAVDARLAEFASQEAAVTGPALPAVTARAIREYVDELLAAASFEHVDGETAHLLVTLLRLVQKLAEVLAESPVPAA